MITCIIWIFIALLLMSFGVIIYDVIEYKYDEDEE